MNKYTINSLIKELKNFKLDSYVYFDFCECVPSCINSYRGIYTEPALGWKPTGYSRITILNEYPKVKDLIEELERSIGTTFTGWKGGEFTYSGNESLHIDNPGDATNTIIDYISNHEWYIIIHTKREKK